METHAGGVSRCSSSKNETNRNISLDILQSEQFNHLPYILPSDGNDLEVDSDVDSDEDLTENQLAQQSIYHAFLRCHATAKKSTTRPQGINLGTIRARITPFRAKKGRYTMDQTEMLHLKKFNMRDLTQACGLIDELGSDVVRYEAALLIRADYRQIRIRSSSFRKWNKTHQSSLVLYDTGLNNQGGFAEVLYFFHCIDPNIYTDPTPSPPNDDINDITSSQGLCRDLPS